MVEIDEKNRLLKEIMAEHETALLRYATRILNDADTAQDVVQNTFIKMLNGWVNGAKPTPQLKGWLYRVTHNNAIDHIRKESRLRVLHEKQAEQQEVEDAAKQQCPFEREEAMNLALEHLRKLKPEEQQVVLLRLQEGLSYREIADVTKRSKGNVGCILHHAVKKLSKSLKQTDALSAVDGKRRT